MNPPTSTSKHIHALIAQHDKLWETFDETKHTTHITDMQESSEERVERARFKHTEANHAQFQLLARELFPLMLVMISPYDLARYSCALSKDTPNPSTEEFKFTQNAYKLWVGPEITPENQRDIRSIITAVQKKRTQKRKLASDPWDDTLFDFSYAGRAHPTLEQFVIALQEACRDWFVDDVRSAAFWKLTQHDDAKFPAMLLIEVESSACSQNFVVKSGTWGFLETLVFLAICQPQLDIEELPEASVRCMNGLMAKYPKSYTVLKKMNWSGEIEGVPEKTAAHPCVMGVTLQGSCF